MVPTTETVQSPTARIASIDVFRGLTMAVMIFVNALSDVRGLPWWTYHAPARVDVMTYVDMVFPFFLFAVGLSLPLSVERRLQRTPSRVGLWAHVAVRSLSLIALGLVLANADKADRVRMGLNGNVWALLALMCAALFLLDCGKLPRIKQHSGVIRVIGFVGLVILYGIFRRTTPVGQVGWIDTSYPEILGLIGFSYFAAAILYIPTRRWVWASAVWFILLVCLCAVSTAGMLEFPMSLSLSLWPWGNGAMCCIIMAGILTSTIISKINPRFSQSQAIAATALFGLAALVAGRMLVPLGISKIRATPTWSLYSVGASAILFAFLYWVCDVKQWRRWALPVHAAGSNTLLTYLLPDVWYFLLGSLGLVFWDAHFTVGWMAVVKTLVFTAMMLAIAAGLTRAKIRLQL